VQKLKSLWNGEDQRLRQPTKRQPNNRLREMKSSKVMLHGKHLRDIYPHATRLQIFKYKVRRFTRKILIVTSFGLALTGSYALGAFVKTTKVTQAETSMKSDAPVLERIAQCESGGSQYDKTGQITLHANSDGTIDVGKYQVNSKWFKKATSFGYDLTKSDDNRKMAEWIYANRGTGDWQSSARCWQK
jgi:hypothetical protein